MNAPSAPLPRDDSAEGGASPAFKATLTLIVVAVLCAAFVLWKLDYSAVPPSAFRAEARTPRRPPVALQMRVVTEPPGALVTGPGGLREVTPFFVTVPPDQDLPLRFVLPGHRTEDIMFHPRKAEIIRVVMKPEGAAPAP